MKRIAVMLCAVLGLAVSTGSCEASWGHLGYSGYQPWWNIFAKRYKCLTPEEERLQKFWHDYYDSLKNFYCALDAIDWVAYYKNHGYQINACGPGGSCGRINYAPVFVSPTLQWAVPASCACGPPSGPGYGPSPMMAGPPPMMAGPPPMMGYPMAPPAYAGYPGGMASHLPMPGPLYPPPARAVSSAPAPNAPPPNAPPPGAPGAFPANTGGPGGPPAPFTPPGGYPGIPPTPGASR
jgi:hypothetical protein